MGKIGMVTIIGKRTWMLSWEKELGCCHWTRSMDVVMGKMDIVTIMGNVTCVVMGKRS